MQICFFHTTTIKGILKKSIFFKKGSTKDFKNTGSCFPKPLPMRDWKKTRCSPNFHLAVSRIHGVVQLALLSVNSRLSNGIYKLPAK